VIFIAFYNSGDHSFYSGSLLDAAFMMWCKVVVNSILQSLIRFF